MIGTKIKLAIIGAIALALFGAGWTARDWRCDATEAKAQLAAERTAHAATRKDLAAAKAAAAFANVAFTGIETANTARQETVRERESQPVDACRRLDRAGLEWLRRIAPD